MSIAILHLSDIHFRESDNNVAKKVSRISGVLQSWCFEYSGINICFIVVTGDIATSGSKKEYDEAIKFFTLLKKNILEANMVERLEYIAVPGNHDCNLEKPKAVRNMLISKLLEKGAVETDESIINQLAKPQQEFFNFLKKLTPGFNPTRLGKLYYRKDYSTDEYNIQFNCYNTALTSIIKEKQGEIVFPMDLVKDKEFKKEYAVTFSIFHHPYNWFEVANKKTFKEYVEYNSDIILTGHEHDPAVYTVKNISDDINDYMEGGNLQSQDLDNEESSFNGIIIDLETRLQKRFQYFWDGVSYKARKSTQWLSLNPGKKLKRQFENNSAFRAFLEDIGTGFRHRYVNPLHLDQLFVYPELLKANIGADKLETTFDPVPGEKLIERVIKEKTISIIGDRLTGKSSLVKTLYNEFTERGFTPITICGTYITSIKPDTVRQLISNCFSLEYSPELLEDYKQLPKAKKVLILEDLNEAKPNYRGKMQLLNSLSDIFEIIVITGTDILIAEECSEYVQDDQFPHNYYSIAELGYQKRRILIEKWLILGRETLIEDLDLFDEIKHYENIINRLIGTKLLPSTPFVVLTLLQMIEANAPMDTASGSHGHMYEFIITGHIANNTSRVEDLPKKYDFMSDLAYYLFERNSLKVNDENIKEIANIIFEKRDIAVDCSRLINELAQAGIFSVIDGHFYFRWPYLYHYFVARYMSQYLRDHKEGSYIQNQLNTLAKNLYREDYANIIIFLCYLSKDPIIIDTILENSRNVFKGGDVCDLDKHIAFLNDIRSVPMKLTIENKPVRETSKEYLKARDELHDPLEDNELVELMYNFDDVDDIKQLPFMQQFIIALKTTVT